MIGAHAEFDKATGKAIATAVVIAGLSALATKLVEWGVEAMKARTRGKREVSDG